MQQAIKLLIFMAVFNAIIYGVFKFLKRNNKIYVEGVDQSMEPAYPAGTTYLLTADIQRSKDIKGGEAVAYFLPNNLDKSRVGWVIAREGQKVSSDNDKWYVNGEPVKKERMFVMSGHKVSEYIVPRGCVFIIPNLQHDEDSSVLGPIPVRCILGRMPSP